MKHRSRALITCLLVVFALSQAWADNPTVSLLPDSTIVPRDTVFVLTMPVSSNSVHLKAYSAAIAFDRNYIATDSANVTEGALLAGSGRPTFFWTEFSPDSSILYIDGAILGDSAYVSGAGNLATIKFFTRAWGQTDLDFISFRARDEHNAPLQYDSIGGWVQVNQPPVVSGIPNQMISAGGSSAPIYLDNYVTDPDNSLSLLSWTYSGNVALSVSIDQNRVATVSSPNPVWSGSELIVFKATDPWGQSSSCPAVFTVNLAMPCPSDMTHYWKLDETAGQPYLDFYDADNAICSECPTATTGRVNGGQLFDLNDSVTVADDDSFDWGATSSFSIELWMKKGGACSGFAEVIAGRLEYEGPYVMNWWLGVDCTPPHAGAIRFRMQNNVLSDVWSSVTVNDDAWHHVVATRDGSASLTRIYVDGQERGTVTQTFTLGFAAEAPMTVGYLNVTGGYHYGGALDEFALYNNALSATEIQNHYDRGLLGLGYCNEPVAPLITSTPPTSAIGGRPYTYEVQAVGTPPPIFTLATYPTDMTIDNYTGVIHWTPRATGDFAVAVVATNVAGGDTQSYSINVPGIAPTITSIPVPVATVGYLYIYDVEAAGLPAPAYSLFATPPHSLPPGMHIDPVSGIINWTPADTGHYELNVDAVNAWGADTQMFMLTVVGVGPAFISTPVTEGEVDKPYSYDADASGYPAPRYSLYTPPSPLGMVIDSLTGMVSWTPTDSGSFNVKIRARNLLDSAFQNYTINVLPKPPLPCPDSITHYWKLEETSGGPYQDFVANNDAICGPCPTAVPGRVGTGQRFNGSNLVTVADDGTFDWGGGSSFTIEFWINKTDSATHSEVVLGRVEGAMNWWIGVNSDPGDANRIRFRLVSGGVTDLYSNSRVTDGNWHHIAATRDGATRVTKLYVDNVLEASMMQSHASGFAAWAPMSIGWLNTGAFYYYNGIVDEVALYNRALDPREIGAHYANGMLGLGYCEFTCGDANGDGSIDISDVVFLISYIFANGPAPAPLLAGDANCDLAIDISDAVYIIQYIFSGGPAPCALCP